MSEDIVFDASSRDYLMRANNLSVGFNMPKALEGNCTFNLPPYCKRMPYLVDKFPSCPKDWMRSEGKIKSYFVPVIEGDGMWLDFNNNCKNPHHVAIVISVQGINPITGLPCKDFQMEQYIEECPKHKIKFGPDRYCKECDYKWPKQNYICTTGTPDGNLWIDGFRTAEGVVRQYILTSEKMRGVASNIIGKDRVYAIGISFFLSKEKKIQKPQTILRSFGAFGASSGDVDFQYLNTTTADNDNNFLGIGELITDTIYDDDSSICCSSISDGKQDFSRCIDNALKKNIKRGGIGKGNHKKKSLPSALDSIDTFSKTVKTTKLEVGAGSKINQSVYDDPDKLDYWHDDPESIICINYCTESECRSIIEGGMVDVEGNKDGFLQGIPVGN